MKFFSLNWKNMLKISIDDQLQSSTQQKLNRNSVTVSSYIDFSKRTLRLIQVHVPLNISALIQFTLITTTSNKSAACDLLGLRTWTETLIYNKAILWFYCLCSVINDKLLHVSNLFGKYRQRAKMYMGRIRKVNYSISTVL